MDLTELPITWRAVIPDAYLDANGHMNVMWYTHLFSCAVGQFFESFELTPAYFEANQAGSFALEVHTRYLAEVRVGNHVTVRSRALGRTAKRVHYMSFMVIDHTGVLAATEECVGTHVDLRVRRSSPLPASVVEAFDRLLAEHQRLSWAAPVCGVMHP
jgi:acyl-CoA thioester hydrolase